MANGGGSRGLYLAAALSGPAAPAHLLLAPLVDGSVQEVAGGPGGIAAPPGAVVVLDGRRPEVRARPGGGLTVTRSLLWSLLDPCRAGDGPQLGPADPIDAERQLRAEARRLLAGLRRWRELPPPLLESGRGLLAAFDAAAGRLWDALSEWAAAAPPEAPLAAPAPAPADAAPASPAACPEAPAELAAWLTDPRGFGAVYGAGFTPRPQQGQMAASVAAALDAGRPLLIEVGTGCGKTVAYLVPLLSRLAREGGRGVVATHTRALQAQILERDLPRLRPLFPGVSARLLMGRRNYLCQRRKLRFLARPNDSFAAAAAQATFRLWLAATEEGLREELAEHPFLAAHLAELFDSPEPCSPSVCHADGECFVVRARRLAREADLVIVNHSLLMNDFAAGRTLIGPYARLVVDEAHRLPQAALETQGVRLDLARLAVIEELLGEARADGAPPEFLRALARRLAGGGEAEAAAVAALAALGRSVGACFRAYRVWLAAVGRAFEARVAELAERPAGRVRVHDAGEAFGPVRDETSALLTAAAAAGAAFAAAAAAIEAVPDLPAGSADELGTLARAGELLAALAHDIRFVTAVDDPDWVVWLEPDTGAGVRAAGATRLEAGPLLRDCWQTAGLAPIVTSATLGVGADFSHMLGELGLRRWQPPCATELIASPFDYERQALFLTLPDLPAPDRHDFLPALAELLGRLLGRVRRKTLVLFTSYQALQRVAVDLQARFGASELFGRGGGAGSGAPDAGASGAPGTGAGGRGGKAARAGGARGEGRARNGDDRDGDDPAWPPLPPPVILAQLPGMEAGELLQRFRRERRALLLGTATFWEGLDFPGGDLEILVVTKLPFLVPNDPWVEARCDRLKAEGENPFETFMVRDAVLRLRQGIGRLIRRDTDRGVAILLDSRLHSKPYGVTFLNALPASPRFCPDAEDLVAKVTEFFASGP